LLESGQYAGDGANNPYKSPLITGFALTAGERDDLLTFLESLTDEGALADPRFADPFCRDTGDVDCLEPLELR
jgi:cytochrome c peroxidase